MSPSRQHANVHALLLLRFVGQLKAFRGCVELRHASNSGDKREFFGVKQRPSDGRVCFALYIS